MKALANIDDVVQIIRESRTRSDASDSLIARFEFTQIQADAIGGCLFALEELDLLEINFSETLWNAAVDHVTVYADERLEFCFTSGTAITVQMA
jgi:hypothetical protein